MIPLNYIAKNTSTLLLLWSMTASVTAQTMTLSTDSDSAKYYYYQGWEQVLDYGHFGNSEAAYRHMFAHDEEFLLGASLLARITTNPSERKQLIADIEHKAARLSGDEAELLKVFVNLAKIYVYREDNQWELLKTHRLQTLKHAEITLRKLAHMYPNDVYYKSEYVEFLHANHGPKMALDSLQELFKKPPPFMLSYSAQLLGELDLFDEAWETADRFKALMASKNAPQVPLLYAKLYKLMGKNEQALLKVNRALVLDPGQQLALRLKEELTKEINRR